MLRLEDFYPHNWESVTWQIVSNTYVKGYILSECIPPTQYIQWVTQQLDLFSPGTIKIENTVSLKGEPLWKLTIRQPHDSLEGQESSHIPR